MPPNRCERRIEVIVKMHAKKVRVGLGGGGGGGGGGGVRVYDWRGGGVRPWM